VGKTKVHKRARSVDRKDKTPFKHKVVSSKNNCAALVQADSSKLTLMSSAKQTVIGAFVAAFFSLQMIFLSAKLHERARYNHVIEKMIDQEENPHRYGKDGEEKEEPKEDAEAEEKD
jgi:hypothetical protein